MLINKGLSSRSRETSQYLRPETNGRQFCTGKFEKQILVVKMYLLNSQVFLRGLYEMRPHEFKIDLAPYGPHGFTWWHHQMAICAGNSPVPAEFPAQRPVTQSSDVFFDLRLHKRLSKQSWGWWFETLSRPLWRYFIDTNFCRQHSTIIWNH